MTSIKYGTYTPPKKEDLMKGNDVSKLFKENQFFISCYVTDMDLHDGKYALTVVALYDLKRYYEYRQPNLNEKIYRVLDVVSIGLDGNGTPRVGWHEKQLFEEVRTQHYKDGEKMSLLDAILDTGITMESKKVSMFTNIATTQDKPIQSSKQKASHKNLADNLFNKHKLLFGPDKEINLSDDFMTALKEISKFTRETDVTFPYAISNGKIQEFDNIRTAIGLISSIIPIGKAFKLSQTLISALADSISGSSLVVPASDLYDLRGPVKLSKVTYQLYKSRIGQSGKYFYNEIEKEKRENITITY